VPPDVASVAFGPVAQTTSCWEPNECPDFLICPPFVHPPIRNKIIQALKSLLLLTTCVLLHSEEVHKGIHPVVLFSDVTGRWHAEDDEEYVF